MSGIEVSVVMATFNGEAHLEEQLRSIRAQETDRSWELVIADNGSTDDTLAVARRVTEGMSNVRIVVADELPGQSYARTRGAAAASGDLLLFVDQDDRLYPDYVECMAAALRTSTIVAARMDCDLLNPGWERGARTPAQVRELGSGLGFLPYAAGCTIGIRRHAFERVGGFDVSMIGAAEDVDLCWRVQLACACHLVFVPEAVVAYRFRGSMRAIAKQAKGHGIAQAQLVERYRAVGMDPPRWSAIAVRLAVALRSLLRAPGLPRLAEVQWQVAHSLWYAIALARPGPRR